MISLSVERTAAGRHCLTQTQAVMDQALCRFSPLKKLQLQSYQTSRGGPVQVAASGFPPGTCLRQQEHGQGGNGLGDKEGLWSVVGRAMGKGQRESAFKEWHGAIGKSGVVIWEVMALHHLVLKFQLWPHVKRATPPTTCTHHYTSPPCAWIDAIIITDK